MAEGEFPALMEKIARLENTIGALAAQSAEHEADAALHRGKWTLVVTRGDTTLGRWELPSDGSFEWEGEGLTITLGKAVP